MKKIQPLSVSVEDYIRSIYQLQEDGDVVSTTALASALRVSAASATNMIKKLAALKLVHYARYQGVELTPTGEKAALEIVRHHRLVELFLHQTLGIPWDEVHDEAHRLEHVLSDNLEDHIADFLGNPTQDPHGDPIPTKAGAVASPTQYSLADLEPGERAVIRRVKDQDPEHLRYLRKLGLVPNAQVELIEHAPFNGPVRVRVGSREQTVAHPIAKQIGVDLAIKSIEK